MKKNIVERALEALNKGEIIILVDDEKRENEGDFFFPAKFATAEKINFMIKYGRGLVCTPMDYKSANRLDLPLMVSDNNSKCGTPFTVSVDFRENVTTGISAQDRALTAQKLACLNSKASDFMKPGHMFPLIANKRGILERRGQTEASVNLLQLLDFNPPVGVICEIINDDGTMARQNDLQQISDKYNLIIINVEDVSLYIKNNGLESKIIDV